MSKISLPLHDSIQMYDEDGIYAGKITRLSGSEFFDYLSRGTLSLQYLYLGYGYKATGIPSLPDLCRVDESSGAVYLKKGIRFRFVGSYDRIENTYINPTTGKTNLSENKKELIADYTLDRELYIGHLYTGSIENIDGYMSNDGKLYLSWKNATDNPYLNYECLVIVENDSRCYYYNPKTGYLTEADNSGGVDWSCSIDASSTGTVLPESFVNAVKSMEGYRILVSLECKASTKWMNSYCSPAWYPLGAPSNSYIAKTKWIEVDELDSLPVVMKNVDIRVTAPVSGYKITEPTVATDNTKISVWNWYEIDENGIASSKNMVSGAKFEDGKSYRLKVMVSRESLDTQFFNNTIVRFNGVEAEGYENITNSSISCYRDFICVPDPNSITVVQAQITPPVAGSNPTNAVTSTPNIRLMTKWHVSGSYTTMKETETFKAGKSYDVYIYAQPDTGYNFIKNRSVMILNGGKEPSYYDNSETDVLSYKYTFDVEEEIINKSVDLYAVMTPRTGSKPSWSFSISESSHASPNEDILSARWIETSSAPTSIMNARETAESVSTKASWFVVPTYFEKGKYYTFLACVTADDGYAFDSATINGQQAMLLKDENLGCYYVAYTFQPVDYLLNGIILEKTYYEINVSDVEFIWPAIFKDGKSVDETITWNSTSPYISVVLDDRISVTNYDKALLTGVSESGYKVTITVQARFKDVLITGTDSNGKTTYSDGVNSTGYKAVYWAADKGITKGYAKADLANGIVAGTFRPNANVTRQEMAIFLWRMAGSPKVDESYVLTFEDESEIKNATAYKAIQWLSKNGIAKGSLIDGKYYYKPEDNVTRQQIAIFLKRLAEYEGRKDDKKVTVTTFLDDKDISSNNVRNAIYWAVGEGIIKGYSGDRKGYFGPKDPCTRLQMAIMLMRYAKEA